MMLRKSNLIPYFAISSLDYWIIVIPCNRSFIKTQWRLPRSPRTSLHMSRGQLRVTVLKLSHLCYGALWLAQYVNVSMVSMNSSSCHAPEWRKETQIWHVVTSNLKGEAREAARRYSQRWDNNWVNRRFLGAELHKTDNGINWDGMRGISWWYNHTMVRVSLSRAHAGAWAITLLQSKSFLSHVT